jgi:hypothetical protein
VHGIFADGFENLLHLVLQLGRVEVLLGVVLEVLLVLLGLLGWVRGKEWGGG